MINFNSIKVRLELDNMIPTRKEMYHFNSIKVRLELVSSLDGCCYSYFNSIKVRLEHSVASRISDSCCYFNSIKVRLELLAAWQSDILCCHFNSIKVRLERIYSLSIVWSPKLFQFHKGTIRTWCEGNFHHGWQISIP